MYANTRDVLAMYANTRDVPDMYANTQEILTGHRSRTSRQDIAIGLVGSLGLAYVQAQALNSDAEPKFNSTQSVESVFPH